MMNLMVVCFSSIKQGSVFPPHLDILLITEVVNRVFMFMYSDAPYTNKQINKTLQRDTNKLSSL